LPRRPTSRWVILPLFLGGVSLLAAVIPQPSGPVAIWNIGSVLALPALLVPLLTLAVVRRDAGLAAATLAMAIVIQVVYAPPASPGTAATEAGPRVTVLTWNMHSADPASSGLPELLAEDRPELVILEEVDVLALGLLDDYQVMHHPEAATPPGMMLATTLPVVDSGRLVEPAGVWDVPRAFWLRLELAGGQPLTVIAVHLSIPFPADSLPCPYCPARRDEQVAAVTDFARAEARAGHAVLIVGDLNLSDREAAYRQVAGLIDLGVAAGATWRGVAHTGLPAILRLDYLLAGGPVGLIAARADCELTASDHCPLVGELVIHPATAGLGQAVSRE